MFINFVVRTSYYLRTFAIKHYGNKIEYEEERNNDLMKVYRRLITEHKGCIVASDIFRQIASCPAQRFYVSEERAAIVFSRILRGDTLSYMRQPKREMFLEIYRRMCALREKYPDMNVIQLASAVVHQEAPSFYLAVGYIKVIIYKMKKQLWHEKRKILQGHLH